MVFGVAAHIEFINTPTPYYRNKLTRAQWFVKGKEIIMHAGCFTVRGPATLIAGLLPLILSISSANHDAFAVGFVTEVQKLAASDNLPGDFYGWTIDIDDGTAITGSFPLAPGVAYLYDTKTFVETKLATPVGVTADDAFGSVVSIGGGRALVGAPGFPDVGLSGGIYAYDVSTGALDAGLGKITPSDSENDDEFGFSLAQNGTNALVGALRGNLGSGKAYLFDTATGTQVGDSFTASDGIASDFFGYSVDIDGDWALVGAPFDTTVITTNSGAVYLYDLANNRQETKLTPCPVGEPTCLDGIEFGWSVAIDGNRAVVGAPNRGLGNGRAYVFNDLRSPTNPIILTPPVSFDGDDFGYAVDILGDVVIVGAPADENPADEPNSNAYVYNVRTGMLLDEIPVSDGAGDDEYGFSVELWNNQALIGAPLHDLTDQLDEGAAYLFSLGKGGDTDLDRDIDITDFNAVAINFDPLAQNPPHLWFDGNFDGDLDIDITDFNLLAINFAPFGYASQAGLVPEPATLLLVSVSLAILICWRQR